MVFRYLDPVADAEAYFNEQATAERPRCSICGEKITDETFYNIDNHYICNSCMDDYRVYTEDYME